MLTDLFLRYTFFLQSAARGTQTDFLPPTDACGRTLPPPSLRPGFCALRGTRLGVFG